MSSNHLCYQLPLPSAVQNHQITTTSEEPDTKKETPPPKTTNDGEEVWRPRGCPPETKNTPKVFIQNPNLIFFNCLHHKVALKDYLQGCSEGGKTISMVIDRQEDVILDEHEKVELKMESPFRDSKLISKV